MDAVLERALEIIDGSGEEIIAELQKLISFRSVAADEEDGAPFGAEVDKAFKYMLSRGEDCGFAVVNTDGYGGHIQINGSGAGTVGIAGHIDVVPAGEGWDYDPFGGEIHEGKLYGRGAMDDKGPVIAAFNAMKALKKAGFRPAKNIRLILGLDEEASWKGMHHYLNVCGHPDSGFTPDGSFPVICGEKGILAFDIVGKLSRNPDKGLRLTSLSGGQAHNMVPGEARATVLADDRETYASLRELTEGLKREKGYRLSLRQTGKSVRLTAAGVSAHGARPETGLNAVSVLMDVLGQLTFANEDHNDMIRFYNEYIGFETDGSSLGISMEDEESGRLTLNSGLMSMDRDSFTLGMDVRYPITCKAEDVYAGMEKILERYNLGVIKKLHHRPIYIPEDSELVTTLMDVYRRYFNRDDQPLVIGGGTYARAVNNIVAFGPGLPDREDVAHSKNEYIETDHLMNMTAAYAETVYRLSR